jgi:hypothetical protein
VNGCPDFSGFAGEISQNKRAETMTNAFKSAIKNHGFS